MERGDSITHTARKYNFGLFSEQAVSLDKAYIFDLDVKRSLNGILCAVCHSDNAIEIYEINNTQFNLKTSLKGHTAPITNVRFNPVTENVFYSSSKDGTLKVFRENVLCCDYVFKVWDIRKGKSVQELKGSVQVPLTCSDVSCNGRIICAGSDLVKGDAYILFWDARSCKLLGGYWESHTDEITNISFHPQQQDSVASGSIDGLVNLFDLSETCEDDALRSSLNTETTVSNVSWQTNETLSVVTHTETVQKWHSEGSGPEVTWSRESIAKCAGMDVMNSYIAGVHTRNNGEMFIVAGSYEGKSEDVKILDVRDNKLIMGDKLIGNHQIIRASRYISEIDQLFTVGEGGVVSVWRPDSAEILSSGLKEIKMRNKKKYKPY